MPRQVLLRPGTLREQFYRRSSKRGFDLSAFVIRCAGHDPMLHSHGPSCGKSSARRRCAGRTLRCFMNMAHLGPALRDGAELRVAQKGADELGRLIERNVVIGDANPKKACLVQIWIQITHANHRFHQRSQAEPWGHCGPRACRRTNRHHSKVKLLVLKPFQMLDPMPLRPPGYFNDCYDKSATKESNKLAAQSVRNIAK